MTFYRTVQHGIARTSHIRWQYKLLWYYDTAGMAARGEWMRTDAFHHQDR